MRIVVVGAGKVGRVLTEQLAAEKHDIVVIDQDSDLIESLVNIYDVRGVAGFVTASDVALEADRKPTFRTSVIDYFFLTGKDFLVTRYTVDDSLIDGEAPSDHCPILITYDFAG